MTDHRLGFNEHGILEWVAERPNITAGAPAWDQQAYRVRDDSAGLNTSSGWLGTENNDPTADIGVGTANKFRIRFCLDETNNKTHSITPNLYYNRNSGGWVRVTATSDYVRAVTSGSYTDGDSCSTRLLTASTPGNGSFENDGEADCDDGGTAAHTLSSKGNYFEGEFCVYLYDGGAGWTDQDTVEFAVFNITGQLDTYAGSSGAKGPTVTVSAVTTVDGVGTATGSADAAATASVTHYATNIRIPTLINEQFESAGYDHSWSPGETVGAGSDLDPDYLTSLEPWTGGITNVAYTIGTQMLEVDKATGENCFVKHTFTGEDCLLISVDFLPKSLIGATDQATILVIRDETNTQDLFIAALDLDLGSNRVLVNEYSDGSVNSDSIIMATPQWQRLWVKWDQVNGSFEWGFNNVSQLSNALSGAAVNWKPESVRIGPDNNTEAVLFYINNVGVDDKFYPWTGTDSAQEWWKQWGKSEAEATGQIRAYGSATVTGQAEATATATVVTDVAGVGTVTGNGFAAATATVKHYAIAIAAGIATVVAVPTVVHNAVASVTGSAEATATGMVAAYGEATVTGNGYASGTASVTHNAVSTVTGNGYANATASVTHNAVGTATGNAYAAGDATLYLDGSEGTATGQAEATGTGLVNTYGLGLATGTGSIIGVATLYLESNSATVTGSAEATGTSSVTHNAVATVTGQAEAEATGSLSGDVEGEGTVTGNAYASATADVTHNAVGTATGSAEATGTADVTHNAVASVTGNAYVSGTSSVTHNAVGTVTGTGYAAGTADVTHNAVGTATGQAEATGTGSISGEVAGAGTVTGNGYAAGTASVTHNGVSSVSGQAFVSGTATIHLPSAEGIATGSAEATGTGLVNTYGLGLATGTGSIFGTATLYLAANGGTATGTGYAEATGSLQVFGDGTATGIAYTDADGTVEFPTVEGVGTATGTGYAAGDASVVHNAVGTATGQAFVEGTATSDAEPEGIATGTAYASATSHLSVTKNYGTVTGKAYAEGTLTAGDYSAQGTITGKAYAWGGDYPGYGYIAYLDDGIWFRLARYSALAGIQVIDSVAYEHAPDTYYNIVLEADGTTLRAKVWSDAESEPAWMISVTEAQHASGSPGMVALSTTEVLFDVFSTGLGGDPYPLGRLPGTPTWILPVVPVYISRSDPPLTLEWTQPPMTGDVMGGAVAYELEYRRDGDTAWTNFWRGYDRTYDWDMSGLPAGEYCVRVRAYVGCEYGPWAELCGITFEGKAPVFETPDGYYFGDDNVGQPDHGMWIRLFQASHLDDDTPVTTCLVSRELIPAGVGGECLFQKLYLNLTYTTAATVLVTPILDGKILTEEVRTLNIDPNGQRVVDRFEIDLSRNYESATAERFRYGMRGTYFQIKVCVIDIGGTGRVEIDGVSMKYLVARETHTWARPFYGELETDIELERDGGYFMGTATEDVPAALYQHKGASDFGFAVAPLVQPRAIAPFGTSEEAWFRSLYLCITRSNTSDWTVEVVPILDGTELEAVEVTLPAVAQPLTEVHEVPLSRPHDRSDIERSRYGLRGVWFTYRIRTVGRTPEGEVAFDGTSVEAIPCRETEASS